MASNYTQPINIGNPVEHTIEEFAEIIRDLVGGKSKILQTPAVEDDPQRRKPDITRARVYLNWEPRVPLKLGLEKTIRYFERELDRSNHSGRNVFVPDRDIESERVQHLENNNNVNYNNKIINFDDLNKFDPKKRRTLSSDDNENVV